MRWWKILGLAAFTGVAATGVVVARAERRRLSYTPDQIRGRLRARLAEAADPSPGPATSASVTSGLATPGSATPLGRLTRRLPPRLRERLRWPRP
ncbi:hypothetical protein [Sphaerisporangium sp. TRM90804]|uniref:hypothetical protein n=1 Tax=Sphaerisporangium sp. TRM90804 TaxID=3031113 RepID=UPI002449FC41|nr:hypothetical protein [Sphaerisporangium sp. TRM90804]MDH2424918.1 hypothetical protein [Sphaerisporangium sp. TRM90804]